MCTGVLHTSEKHSYSCTFPTEALPYFSLHKDFVKHLSALFRLVFKKESVLERLKVYLIIKKGHKIKCFEMPFYALKPTTCFLSAENHV